MVEKEGRNEAEEKEPGDTDEQTISTESWLRRRTATSS